jgi:NAD(P)-dependent dehydrogenase (short-subunit alcohol dehydrogenase family)
VNYLAPVVLARALLPLLIESAPARIVNVGSIGQVAFDLDGISFESGYAGVAACRRAKLALAAFTFDLAEELRGTGVTANCVHPASLMNTAMVIESGFPVRSTVREGTDATLRLITDPALETVTGEFFNGLVSALAHPEAHSREFQRRLRAVTELQLGRSGV